MATGKNPGPWAGKANTLKVEHQFASVLDCPGGGLRIDTIHAFAQWLLAAFPSEAGLLPGVRAMEDRDRDLLLREVLAELLLVAERTNDAATLDALARLSVRMGPDKVPAWLLRCASARDAWTGPGGWLPPMKDGVHRLLGLPADASSITAFIEDHAGACQTCSLSDATIWTDSQRAFLKESINEDSDWAILAEQLTSLLRDCGPPMLRS